MIEEFLPKTISIYFQNRKYYPGNGSGSKVGQIYESEPNLMYWDPQEYLC